MQGSFAMNSTNICKTNLPVFTLAWLPLESLDYKDENLILSCYN